MIKISDHPSLQYNSKPVKRYVDNTKKVEDLKKRELYTYTTLYYYIEVDWEDVLYEAIKPVDVTLIATDEIMVNKNTGQFADWDTLEEDKIWEYSFIRTQTIASLEQLEINWIMRADVLWRFDK